MPSFDEIYPGKPAPVLRRAEGGALKLEIMEWGFPGPAAAKGRPITNIRNLASPFWRSALNRPDRRCVVPVSRFCEWEGEKGSKRKVWFGLNEGADPLFAFAGLWRPGEGGVPYMAFLTCEPEHGRRRGASQGDAGHAAPADVPTWLDSGGRDRLCACGALCRCRYVPSAVMRNRDDHGQGQEAEKGSPRAMRAEATKPKKAKIEEGRRRACASARSAVEARRSSAGVRTPGCGRAGGGRGDRRGGGEEPQCGEVRRQRQEAGKAAAAAIGARLLKEFNLGKKTVEGAIEKKK